MAHDKRAPYEEQSEADRERYRKEMAEWTAANPELADAAKKKKKKGIRSLSRAHNPIQSNPILSSRGKGTKSLVVGV